MDRICGGGKMRGPLFDLLFAGAEAGTLVAIRTTLTFFLAATHHRGWAFLEFVNADGEEADHVLVDVRLALKLGDSCSRGIEVQSDIMRLAVLGDAIGEGAQAPGLGLYD